MSCGLVTIAAMMCSRVPGAQTSLGLLFRGEDGQKLFG